MTDNHAENKRLYAIDRNNHLRPFVFWESRSSTSMSWVKCSKTPEWSELSEYRRIESEEPEIDSALPDPGQHYRFMHNGINIDPAWIEKVCGPMTGMQFTILKKVIRMGTGGKTKRQDLLDIIAAAQRELELMSDD